MVRKPRKNVIFRGKLQFFAENHDFQRKIAIFSSEQRHFFAEAFSGHDNTFFDLRDCETQRLAHKGAKSEKGAKRKNALNESALSEALKDKDKVTKFLPNTLCRSGFPLLECTCFLFNFKFFSAFIIQEIRIQHNKKWEGIAVNVHRKLS